MDVEDMKNPTEVYVYVISETAAAVCVTDDPWSDQDREVWLPKSQIHCDDIRTGKDTEITMPEWLAVDKGLV